MALPKPLLLGPEISRGSTTPNLTPQLFGTTAAVPPLYVRRWARNGRYPDAWFESALGEAMNQAGMCRTKEVFHGMTNLPRNFLTTLTKASTTRARWRWAFHTGPLTHQVMVVCVMHPNGSTTVGDSHASVQIQKPAGGGSQSDEFHTGANGSGSQTPNAWQFLRPFTTYLPVDPDTDYVGVFTDEVEATIQSALVVEVASMTQNNNGYFPQNVPERAPILSTDRQRMATLIRTLWRRGGSHVLNWHRDDSTNAPRSIATSTPTNLHDGTTTAISSSSFGHTLDMRYKDRLTQTSGVPCKMYVYAGMAAAGASGTVYLKNSAGTTITSVAGFTSTAGWQSVQFNLPATLDKYDLMGANGGAGTTLKVHAVSIFEHEA